jgi:hypothetical protein
VRARDCESPAILMATTRKMRMAAIPQKRRSRRASKVTARICLQTLRDYPNLSAFARRCGLFLWTFFAFARPPVRGCARRNPVARSRTMAVHAAGKTRGRRSATPGNRSPLVANTAHRAGADTFADTVAPAIREAQAPGAKSLRQIAAALNGRGIANARGGKWEAAMVAERVASHGMTTRILTSVLLAQQPLRLGQTRCGLCTHVHDRGYAGHSGFATTHEFGYG